MSLRTRTRRILLALFLLFAVLMLIWVSMPVWFPWVLPPVARKAGVGYARYERLGYSRFALDDLTYAHATTRLKARRVEAFVPTVWLWRCLLRSRDRSKLFVNVQDWKFSSVRSQPAPNGTKQQAANSFRQVPPTISSISRWIPRAEFSNGTLELPGITASVPELIWSAGSLSGTVVASNGPSFKLLARPAGSATYQARLTSEEIHLSSDIVATVAPAGVTLRSTNLWWNNPIETEAHFEPGSSLPESASLAARQLKIPPQALGLRYYSDISGAVSAHWQSNAFVLQADAQAQPLNTSTNFPPLTLKLHARGDTNSAIIETARVVAPWLSAELSREFEIHFTGPLLAKPAFVKLSANLGAQPWFSAQGELQAEADLRPVAGKFPQATFRVLGSRLGYSSLQTRSFAAQGSFEWPLLEIAKAEAVFEDGSVGSLAGSIDLQTKLTRAGHITLRGPLLARWLPSGYGFESMTATGTFAGPLSALHHEGSCSVAHLTGPQFQPLNLEAHWAGVQTNLQRFAINTAAASSSILIEGALALTNGGMRLTLSSLELRTNEQATLRLANPSIIETVSVRKDKSWSIRVAPLLLEGSGGRVELQTAVEWPAEGSFKAHLEKVSSDMVSGFLTSKLPDVQLARLDVTGGWSNSPVQFELSLQAAAHAPGKKWERLPLGIALEASGNQSGILLTNLLVTSQTSTVVVAHGSLPLHFAPGQPGKMVQLEADKSLNVIASTGPNAFFWQEVAQFTRLSLRNPRAHLEISGTWNAPVGNFNLRAEEIQLPKLTTVPLKNLELALELDHAQARLTSGQALVEGQRVALIGEVPLGARFWSRLSHQQPPDWRTATAHLQIQEAELAAFQPLFPTLLAPQGEVSVDLALQRGGNLEGQILVDHARTRPLGTLGPIRDIGLNIRLHERAVELRGATGRIGGSTLTLSGQLDLSGTEWLQGEVPPFAISVHGLGIPLARQPEYIVRSDLLLGVVKTNGAPPVISGSANLHDSYYLSDLRALIPGKIASPSVRPPYFSIDDPVLADWRLAVQVQGAKFMKLRSTLFNGEISANVKLLGTLKDPIALGDLKIDSGLVRFPFASLQVQQGLVNLTSQDPYRPQLSVLAASKQFGYDIRMVVSGPVDAPVIQFNSTPPLSSEQILLMVSAGELPQGTFNLSPQQRAQTVALFLGRDILSKLGIGDQAEQRLTIRTGEEITDQGRPTYRVEYKLSDRWSVTGEYDRFGDFNAGFKWRVYSR